jgi:hypothetical protein
LSTLKACDFKWWADFLKEKLRQRLWWASKLTEILIPVMFCTPYRMAPEFLTRIQGRGEILILIFWKSAFFVFLLNNFWTKWPTRMKLLLL